MWQPRFRPSAVRSGKDQCEKMHAYVFEGRRHDTGDKLGFLKSTVEFPLKRLIWAIRFGSICAASTFNKRRQGRSSQEVKETGREPRSGQAVTAA